LGHEQSASVGVQGAAWFVFLQMEDMLDLVQHGAIKAIDLRAKQEQLRETDRNYIHAKLQQLHQHAQLMLDSVLNNPNITEDAVKQMAQHEK
jgi:hypothetical protein